MLAIRLDPEIEKRLTRLAEETGRTKTFYVREAILEHLDEIEDAQLAAKRLARIGKTHSAAAVKRALSKEKEPQKKIVLPDFMARLKKDFGGRMTPDSKPIFDEMRAERF